MRDGQTSNMASISLLFSNGVNQPPVNTNTFAPTTGIAPLQGQPLVLAAVGDGASGETPGVTDQIASWNPNLFLYLGDVYEVGTYTEMYNWYGVSQYFGQFRSITNPVVGNHEYVAGVATGYHDYWDLGPNTPAYYSYNAGGWHFIAIDSNSEVPQGQGVGSTEYNWLANDLSNNTAACTLAYFHHPVYSIGPEGYPYEGTPRMNAMWSLMVQNHVDIVLNGHDHDYQRWMPLDANGNVDAQNGITEFVDGGGGHGIQTFVTSDTRVAKGYDAPPTTFGALKMLLFPSGTTYQYINTSGTVLDSGTIPCHAGGADTTPPTVPGNVNAHTDNLGHVVLNWAASTDNVAIHGYTVYRDGQILATTSGGILTYADPNVNLGASYNYTVDAFDPSDNHSAQSNAAPITIPSQITVTVNVSIDSYVDSTMPGTNFGSSTALRTKASVQNSYLRFNVQGLPGGYVNQATLKIYSTSTSSLGYDVFVVADNNWTENGIKFSNAPAFGNALGFNHSITANTWSSIDITSAISGNGSYNFGYSSTSNTSLTYASREAAGGHAAQLVIVLSSQPPPPPTPTPTATNTPTPTDTATPTPTPTPSSLLTIPAAADSYVDASQPSVNFGTSTLLRTDATPVIKSYLRFNVTGVSGAVTSAVLRIYANGSSTIKYDVEGVADNTWTETGINASNAPAIGSIAGSSPQPYSAGWIDVDVTSLVTGNGSVSFALTTTNATAMSFGSRESANKPQLIIQVNLSTPTPTDTPLGAATSTPTNTPTATNTPTVTPTVTLTPTNTKTLTPTNTFTPTPTFTSTATNTTSPTLTFTNTATSTYTPTPTNTPAVSITLTPQADSYVDASQPSSNYGTSTLLRTKSSAAVTSYLRFNVTGVSGTVTSATLRIYTNSSSNIKYDVRGVINNTWGETTITASNAPSFGSIVGSSIQPFSAGVWTSVDVTSLVTGNGLVSFAMTSTNTTNVSYSSRTGANPPQLVIQVNAGGGAQAVVLASTSIPTSTPTFANTVTPTSTATNTTTPTFTSTFTPTFTPDAVLQNALVQAQALPQQPASQAVRIESNDSAVGRGAAWQTMSQPSGASGGDYLINGIPNDSLSLIFQGNRIGIAYVQGPSFGSFLVEIDGTTVQTVNTNAPVYDFSAEFTLAGLSDGKHTLRIMPVNGVVGIDAFDVWGTVIDGQGAAPTSTVVLATIAATTEIPTTTQTALPTTSVPSPTVTVTSTPAPLPVTDETDSSVVNWQFSGGWTLSSTGAYSGSGQSWQLIPSASEEILRWDTQIDLRSVPSGQSTTLTFESQLQSGSGTGQVEISIDGSAQWITVATIPASNDWTAVTLDLGAFIQHTIQIQFVWDLNAGSPAPTGTVVWRLDHFGVQSNLTPSNTATPVPVTATSTATDTETATTTPTSTETPTSTLIPTPSPTLADTPTDVPTPTPTIGAQATGEASASN